jgi:hypothetical protein
MPRVGLEPTTLAIERAKTVHALECLAAVIGRLLPNGNVTFLFAAALALVVITPFSGEEDK